MSEIIKDAKQLLDGATPGPWTAEIESFTENEGGDFSLQAAILAEGEPLMGADDGMVYHKEGNFGLAAAAPELAQALAEETWEYAVQFKNEESGKWYTNDFYSAGIHGQKWFTSKEEAEQQIKRSYPADLVEPREYRIVRRRVSEPEVVNE